MKKAIVLTLLFIISFGFQSCQDTPKKESKEPTEDAAKLEAEDLQNKFNKLMKESVAIHDEVMPKMGTINEYLQTLEKHTNEESNEKAELIMEELKTGHDMMMSWMKGFSNDFTREEINQGISTEDEKVIQQKLELIKKHHKKAQEMQEQINKGLEQAKEFLEQA